LIHDEAPHGPGSIHQRDQKYLAAVLMTYGAVIETREVNHLTYSSIDRLYAITNEKAYDGIRKWLPMKRSRI
jgi:hypothetical protein